MAQTEFAAIDSQSRPEAHIFARQPVAVRMMRHNNHGDTVAPNALHQNLGTKNRGEPYHTTLRGVEHKFWFSCHDHAGRGFVARIYSAASMDRKFTDPGDPDAPGLRLDYRLPAPNHSRLAR